MLKFSYAGWRGLSPAILVQFTLEMHVAAQNCEKNSLKSAILGVKGHSRSSMLTFVRSSSSVLAMISSMAVPICNHLYTKQVNHFLQGYPSSTPTCAGLLESRGSGLGLLKSTWHAENFICRLSWSISSYFSAIQSETIFTCYYFFHLQPKFGCLNIYNFVVIYQRVRRKS